jgi:hypothetical protein
MKKIVFVVLACSFAVAHAQQSETRDPGSFTGVKVAEGVNVYLKKGDKESVRVEATGTNPSNVITEVSGSYLKVHMRDGNYHGHVDVKVYVSYVKLEKLSASSAGSIFSEGTIKSSTMEISALSAGTIEVGLESGNVEVSASSAGDIDLKGKCSSLTVDISSAGEIDAYDLEAENVSASVSSGGEAKINVTKALVAQANSGGTIRYRGSPDKSVTNSNSGGSVKKSN